MMESQWNWKHFRLKVYIQNIELLKKSKTRDLQRKS
jgi:hypothetical protein